MKKTEIATIVFELMDTVPLTDLGGEDLTVPIADIAGLSLLPWFCDVSVQWAFRLAIPGTPFKKSPLKKVIGSYTTLSDDGTLLIGVPGDGIEPSLFVLSPLVDAIAEIAEPGMTLELAAANLGVVKRDWDAKAETDSIFGNQHYLGTFDGSGGWTITRSTPGLTATVLAAALDCGRMVAQNGPWRVHDSSEAFSVAMNWLQSPEANINPMAVQRFISLKNGVFVNDDPGMTRKMWGLGMGFFRHRLAASPFGWPEPGPTMYSREQLEETARAVVG